MTERELSDDGTVSDLPWASVFDAAANVRALGAVQAQGFRAASRLVDRFVTARTDTPEADKVGAAESHRISQDADPGEPWRPSVDRLITGWESLAAQLARSLSNSAPPEGQNPVVDVGGAAARGVVSLSGEPGGAEIWLHNGGAEDLGEIRLRCSDLLAHDGGSVAADTIAFHPAVVPLPARSSRGVVIAVDVPTAAAPGVYRGTLLVDGYPDLWLPVELTLRSTEQ
jgi:hypothetical protein